MEGRPLRGRSGFAFDTAQQTYGAEAEASLTDLFSASANLDLRQVTAELLEKWLQVQASPSAFDAAANMWSMGQEVGQIQLAGMGMTFEDEGLRGWILDRLTESGSTSTETAKTLADGLRRWGPMTFGSTRADDPNIEQLAGFLEHGGTIRLRTGLTKPVSLMRLGTQGGMAALGGPSAPSSWFRMLGMEFEHTR